MKFFYLILLIPFLLLVGGCHKKSSTMKSDKVLRINFQDGDLPSTHPHIGIDYRMRSMQSALFECLTRLNQSGEPQPAAAESIEITPDHTRYTFKIRNAFWSNGQKVRAHQFSDAWKAAIQKGSDCRRPDLFYVIKNAEKIKKGELPLSEAGIHVIDDKTLEIELEHPAPYFLELISNPIFSPLYDNIEEPVIYNGPFVIDEWKHDERIILKKNSLYWDAKNVDLDYLEILFITDPLTAEQLFEKGELDWIGSPFSCLPTDLIPAYCKNGKLQSKEVARVYWLYCNTLTPPFTNRWIRKALAFAIDRDAIVEHVLFGQSAALAPLPMSLSLIKEKFLLKSQDREKAKAYFAKGLEELGLTLETFPVILLSHSHITGQKQLTEIIQREWQDVLGIKVAIEGSEWNVFFSELSHGQFQVGGCLKSALFKDPIYHLELLEDETHPYNISRWENANYKQLLNLARLEKDTENRNLYLKQAEEILVEEMPVIPIYSEAYLYMIRPHIQDAVIHDLGHVDFKWIHVRNQESCAN